MKSRTATVADLYRVELQPMQISGDPRPYMPDEITDEILNIICARAMEHDGKVVACYGLTPCQPGVAEAWALLSEESLKHPKDLSRDVLYWLDWAVHEHQLRRVQATADENHPAAHRWLEWLGFSLEGRMIAFGMHGETCLMYGRV